MGLFTKMRPPFTCLRKLITQYNNIREAREAIRIYVKKYNFERCHSAIGGVPPALVYYPAMLLEAARAAA